MDTDDRKFQKHLASAHDLTVGTEDRAADFCAANERINEALGLRPGAAEAWILKARIAVGLDDHLAALAAIEMARRKRSDMAEVHFWRALILMDLERYNESLESIYGSFERMQPHDEWLVEYLFQAKAELCQLQGKTDAALATFHEGLQYCPDSAILKQGLSPLRREQLRSMLKVIPGGKC